MIITYNGKEYVCKTYSDGRVELRTNKYEDETFKNFKFKSKTPNVISKIAVLLHWFN